VDEYGSASGSEQNPFSRSDPKFPREQVGVCPRCGAPVYEGKYKFYCSSQDCCFRIWKEDNWLVGMRKKVTRSMAAALLKDGRVFVTGFYSERTGRCFDADLVLVDTDYYVNYKLDFRRKKPAKRKQKG
jgi:DNA topoisomerase-3